MTCCRLRLVMSRSPPPPPPLLSQGAFKELSESDPEGFEVVREGMLDCWPSLSYVMSQSSGANVGRDRASNGVGYGPV